MPNCECWNLFKSQQAVHLALRDGRTIDIPAITLPDRSRPVHPTQLYSAIDGGNPGLAAVVVLSAIAGATAKRSPCC